MPQVIDVRRGEFHGPSGFNLVRLILIPVALFLLILIGGSFYTVEPEAVAVVQRFGRYLKISQPGLHGKMPFIDSVKIVPIQRQQKLEFGFRTIEPGVNSRFVGPLQDSNLMAEALMVSGDLNMATVEWIIQYRVDDPKAFSFNLRSPEDTLRDASEAAMRQVIGDHTIDEILTVGRQEIATAARDEMQKLADSYRMGIKIEQVVLQDVTPPDSVKASFNEVNQAQQERERSINQARADYNKVVPMARGEAQQKIQEAEGYALKRVNESMGDATRFDAVLRAYLQAPEVTRRRIYLETMAEVIPKLGRKFIIDAKTPQLLPLLQLQPGEVPAAAAAAAATTPKPQEANGQ